MNRNQKIALGCGGAGCLGLIVVAIAGCAVYFLVYRNPAVRRADRDYTINVNLNSNANRNVNSKSNSNSNANENENSNSDLSASSLSADDKHKLFYAATVTGDTELINRVNVKIGILNADFTPGDDYQQFVAEHAKWSFQNLDFIRSVNTPEKARAYVNQHFPE